MGLEVLAHVDRLLVVSHVSLQSTGSQQKVGLFSVHAPGPQDLLLQVAVVQVPGCLVTASQQGRRIGKSESSHCSQRCTLCPPQAWLPSPQASEDSWWPLPTLFIHRDISCYRVLSETGVKPGARTRSVPMAVALQQLRSRSKCCHLRELLSLAQGQTHATDLPPSQPVCPVPSANLKQCKPPENLSYIF